MIGRRSSAAHGNFRDCVLILVNVVNRYPMCRDTDISNVHVHRFIPNPRPVPLLCVTEYDVLTFYDQDCIMAR